MSLRQLHQDLSLGKLVLYVTRDGAIRGKKFTAKTQLARSNQVRAFWRTLAADANVQAILAAPLTYEWYENLVKKMRKKNLPLTRTAALKNWKSNWKRDGKALKEKLYY
jgi:hypothetical protein